MGRLTKNFKEEEFFCKCPDPNCSGKEQGIINLELVQKIQEIRDLLDRKIFVVSGIRCPFWNTHEGGHRDSFHLPKWGLASDLKTERAGSRKRIIELYLAAEKFGFNGLGFYGSFIHIDIGERISRWVLRSGKYIYLFN
ncbi:hypothetical protein ES703_01613 [subsurface metagenome]